MMDADWREKPLSKGAGSVRSVAVSLVERAPWLEGPTIPAARLLRLPTVTFASPPSLLPPSPSAMLAVSLVGRRAVAQSFKHCSTSLYSRCGLLA